MTLINIEAVITWLEDNLEHYDLLFDSEDPDFPVRNWRDLRIDLRQFAKEKEGSP